MGYNLLLKFYNLMLKFGAAIEAVFAPFYYAIFGSRYAPILVSKEKYSVESQQFIESYLYAWKNYAQKIKTDLAKRENNAK